jgi:hypothetical protein
MSGVLITNKLDGERCLTQNGEDNDWNWWDGYKFLSCDQSNSKQKFTFNAKKEPNPNTNQLEDYYQIQSNGAEMFISRQNLSLHAQPYDVRHSVLGDPNNNRDGKSDRFGIQGVGKNSHKSGVDAVNNGPFTFGSLYYNGYKIDFEGDIVRNFEGNASKDSQKWIKYDLYKQCQARGIPFDGCVATELDRCIYDLNKNSFAKCPREYCLNLNNVGKPECKTWCNENPGACDDVVINYCKANPDDTEYCGCINTQKYDALSKSLAKAGSTLLPSCHIEQCVKPSAYKTQNLKNIICPSQQICLQGVDLEATGTAKTELSNFNFECNQQITPAENKSTDSNPKKTKKSEDDDDEEEEFSQAQTQQLLMIGIPLVLLIFILLIVAII